jgi:mycothiol synthase
MPLGLMVAVAHPDEWAPAFHLMFQHLEPRERETRVATAVRLLNQRDLDPAGVLVVRQAARIRGAMVCLPVPGASGLVWPPQAAEDTDRQEIEDRLLRHASVWLRQRGAKLAQALLALDEIHLGASLERNGLQHIGSLSYLRHDLVLPVGAATPALQLRYEPYSTGDQQLFHQTLLHTYEGTQDCPEVNGVRDLEEVLEGHRAQGVHRPERWWLAREGDGPVGVLLLTEMPEWQALDLSYLGVVPEARRRGMGWALTRKAIHETQAAGAAQLTLAVDARNLPARNLYRRLGFEAYDQREVYLAVWRA